MDKPKDPRHIMHASSHSAAARLPAARKYFDPEPEADEIDPEEEAARVWPVYRDELGIPVEYKKEVGVSVYHQDEEAAIKELLDRSLREKGQLATVAIEWPVVGGSRRQPDRPLAPDVVVFLGLDIDPSLIERVGRKGRRPSYRLWEHGGKAPDWALEIASDRTYENDVSLGPKGKLRRYGVLEVPEYVVLDHEGGRHEPPLQMWKRRGGVLEGVAPDGDGRFWSDVLGLWMGLEVRKGLNYLEFYLPDGAKLLRSREQIEFERREKEEERRQKEEARRKEGEARRLKEAAEGRAEEERKQKVAAEGRAEAAERHAEELARRLAELEARSAGKS